MSESFPKTMLWLIAGLVAGTTGGYFWGADAQSISPKASQPPAIEPTHNNQQQSTGNAAAIAAAISNPTGLQLVGTLVQADRAKSKAWLLPSGSETTQTYAEGDTLPGGYRLTSIGAEDLQVSKDGYSFVIRRASSSSGQNASAPCEAIAQNSHSVAPSVAGRVQHSTRSAGIAGRRNPASNPANPQEAQQPQKIRRISKGWGNKTMVEEGENVLDNNAEDATDLPPDSENTPGTNR